MELYNKGTRALGKNNLAKAITHFKESLRKEGEYKETYLNLGNAYRLTDDLATAEKYYHLANDKNVRGFNGSWGSYALALSNLGLIRYALDDNIGAIKYYDMALSVDPSHHDAAWNKASALLRRGCSGIDIDWDIAWRYYGYRFKRSNPVALDRTLPLWDGFTRVSRIVVLAEQGLGDKIMFGRYIHRLEEFCDEVWVQCPPELDGIFSRWKVCRSAYEVSDNGTVPIVNGVPMIVGTPMCSLAGRFGIIDGEWIKNDIERHDFGCGFNIGFVAGGSTSHANDRNRSVPIGYFKKLAEFGNLWCLSPGVKSGKWYNGLDPKSWEKTISYLKGLDLVITIDSSIAHMAGSLGVECWLLQPLIETDFRWGSAGFEENNIWYKSIRVIRNPGDWERVFERVCEKLRTEKTMLIRWRQKLLVHLGIAKDLAEARDMWRARGFEAFPASAIPSNVIDWNGEIPKLEQYVLSKN